MGEIYIIKKEYKKALNALFKALQMRTELGDKNGISILLLNIGRLYKNIKDYHNAEKYILQSLAISSEINYMEIMAGNYSLLSSIYAEKTNYKNAYHYLLLLKNINDSIYNNENTKQILEIKTKYETEKKEKEIELLNKVKITNDLAFNEKIKKQRTIIISFIIVFLLVTGFSVVLFRLYQHKRNANLLLDIKKIEITRQRDHLELLNKELLHQKEEIVSQRNEIEKKNTHITDSIRYAKRIQQAILPSKELVDKLLPDSFIFFRPKDIVSGDFYWLDKVGEDRVYFAAVDCTGHGVPGALMSIHSFNLLDKALNVNKLLKPSEIIDFLNVNIHLTLQQKSDLSAVNDGMDIAICCFHNENKILEYAGVYNPLYIFRNQELIELKADRKALGDNIFENFQGYANHTVQLKEQDALYIFTDGFTDQFGGKNKQKFLVKQFKETLKNISHLPMTEQKFHLAEIFDNWKGDNDQIDDVLVIGVRV